MKKKIVIVFVILAGICGAFLLWRGISQHHTVTQTKQLFSKAFEAEITLRSGDTALSAIAGRDADGNVTLTVTEPALLSGMIIRQNGSALTVSYGNMEIPLELQKLPASSAIGPLFSLLSGALSDLGAEVTEADDCYILRGESESGPYTVRLDRSNGAVLQVDFPSLGFTCDFSAFTEITA